MDVEQSKRDREKFKYRLLRLQVPKPTGTFCTIPLISEVHCQSTATPSQVSFVFIYRVSWYTHDHRRSKLCDFQPLSTCKPECRHFPRNYFEHGIPHAFLFLISISIQYSLLWLDGLPSMPVLESPCSPRGSRIRTSGGVKSQPLATPYCNRNSWSARSKCELKETCVDKPHSR